MGRNYGFRKEAGFYHTTSRTEGGLKDRLRRALALLTVVSMLMPSGGFGSEGAQRQLKCDIPEHTHSETCYETVQICGEEAREPRVVWEFTGSFPVHAHKADCYDSEGKLICGMVEKEYYHTHSDFCRDTEGNLACGLQSQPKHSHTEACYDGEGNVICGLNPGWPEFTTSAENWKETVVDPGHQHTDGCYETRLICGLQEHTHTDECYEIIVPDEPEPAPEAPVEPEQVPEAPAQETNNQPTETEESRETPTEETNEPAPEVTEEKEEENQTEENKENEEDQKEQTGVENQSDADENKNKDEIKEQKDEVKENEDRKEETKEAEEKKEEEQEEKNPENKDSIENHDQENLGSPTEQLPDEVKPEDEEKQVEEEKQEDINPEEEEKQPDEVNPDDGEKTDEEEESAGGEDSDEKEKIKDGDNPDEVNPTDDEQKPGEQETADEEKLDQKTESDEDRDPADGEDPSGENPEGTNEDGDHPDGVNPEEENSEGDEGLAEEPETYFEGTKVYEGPDYTVTATIRADACFPEDIELAVREILPGTDEYRMYSGQTADAATDEWSEIGEFARFFDITFLSEGAEVEPQAFIDVQITFREAIPVAEDADVQAIHFSEDGANVIESSTDSVEAAASDPDAVDTVNFTADSFSVYGFFQKVIITTRVIAADGQTYRVEVSYGQDAGIPEGAVLSATEIKEGDADYELYRAQAAAALEAWKVEMPGLYDISILDAEGQKVQPKDTVSVSITLENALESEEIKVVHFPDGIEAARTETGSAAGETGEETGTSPAGTPEGTAEKAAVNVEVISAEINDQTVTFEAEAFSVYALAYTVDFHYNGVDYSIPGESQILMSELIEQLHIMNGDALLDVTDVESVAFSDEHLVTVQQVAGLITYNGHENKDAGEKDFLLTSEEPFTSEEKLTITLINGETIEVDVTDAPGDPWYIEDGVLHITSDTAMNFSSARYAPWYSQRGEITSIVIEEGVTKIPQNFVNNTGYTQLTSITVADTVTTIGSSAFRGCPALETVQLGNGIKSIPSSAFYNCASLKNINLENVTTLNGSCFYGCTALENVNLENVTTLGGSCFYGCTALENVNLENATALSTYSFYGCTKLKNVNFGEGITSIPSNAFQNCAALESIDLKNVKTLNGYCFSGCSSLHDVTMDAATTVSDYAFQNCGALETVSMEGATSLGSYSFSGCKKLKEVRLGEGLKTIPSYAFQNITTLETINLEHVETFNTSCFYGCTGLKTADLSSAKTIDTSAFNGCTGLNNVDLPETLTSIGQDAFNNCDSFTEVNIPAATENIGTSAFANCDNLEAVTFDTLNRMTSLSSSVFSGCKKLTEIVLPQDLYTIPASMFSGCETLDTVVMPKSLNTIDSSAFSGCTSLTQADLPAHLTEIRDYAFDGCKKLEDVSFPASLVKIGSYAYRNCDTITDITLPASLTDLGTYAFSECDALETADLSRSKITAVPDNCFRNDPLLESVQLPKTVEKIGASAFNGDTKLAEINLPESLTEIGNSAFSQCGSLSVINDGNPGVLEIPENVTKIGESAFNQCNSLTEVNIPDSVTNLGQSAFANCANLEKAVVGKGVTEINPSVFYNDPKLKSVTFESELITKIPNNAFKGCSGLEEFIFWEGLKEIGTGAFQNCTGLTSLEFPSTLTKIATGSNTTGTFMGCSNLTSVSFQDGSDPLTIGSYAFFGDRKLTSVVFPKNLKTIESYAFCASSGGSSTSSSTSYTTNLTNVVFPADCGLEQIGGYAFYNTKITDLELPPNVKSIGNYAFAYCRNLQSVDLPDSLTSIGEYAFRYNTQLQSVDIPDSVTSIGKGAFQSCSALKEAKLPKDLETLNDSVFNSCSNLQTVQMPEKLKTIGSSTFSGCSALQTIDLPNTLTSIGSYAFSSCSNLRDVTLPSSLTSIGSNAFQYCSSLNGITIPDSVTSIGSYAFRDCTKLKNAKLPANLTTLMDGVFYDCYGLTSVDLPQTLQTIGYNAFAYCSSLPKVDMPASVKTIGSSAFYNCTNLKEVTFPNDSQLTTVGSSAFYSCSSLREIDLPDTVTSIGTSAFEYCRDLKTADLPEQLREISTAAFRYCQNLTDINFHNVTTIGEESFKGCVALKDLQLPTTVTTIKKNAFNGCAGLETVDIPSGTTSIEEGAFTGCKGLNSMRWDAKNGEIDTFSSGTLFDLTIGRDVDHISETALRNLFEGGANTIRFEGGNYLTLPNTKSINTANRELPRPLNDLDAGTYYADPNGVLYAVKDGEATLVYIPDGLTEYTIPETIPADGEGAPIPVTAVKANALYQAQALTSLTIQAPQNIKRIDSSAFANARNLASVNGVTTKAEATALFTNPELSMGNQIFYNTKLDGVPDTSTAGELKYDGYNLEVTISESGDSQRGDRAGNPKTEGQPLEKLATDSTNTYLAYTGETIKTVLKISNPSSEPVPEDGQKVRVYFQLDQGGEIKSFTAGQVYNIKQTKKVGDDFESQDYSVTLMETDVRGVYYFDFDRPLNGFTVDIQLPAVFPSPTTGGGNAVIWAQYMDALEAEAKAGKAQPPAEKHHTINWGTRRDEFTPTKTADSSSTLPVTAASDGEVYVGEHSYTIRMNRDNLTTLNLGRDNMVKAVFTDTITVPDELKINETILREIREGKIRYRNEGAYKYIISPTYGTIFQFYANSNSGFLTPKLLLEENNQSSPDGNDGQGNDGSGTNEPKKLLLQWTIQNSNPNYNAQANQIDLPGYVQMTVKNRVFAIADRTENKSFTIHNDVDVDQYYCYSDTLHRTDDAERKGNTGKANLDFSKTSTSSAKRGEYAPFTLQLKSTGVLPITSTELSSITDDIESASRHFYLPPEGIWQMFQDQHLGDALTITISGAHLYGGAEELAKTRQTVTLINGNTGTTDQSNTGSQQHYKGLWPTEDHITDPSATFIFTKTANGVQVRLGAEGTPQTVNSAEEIRNYLDQQGFFVTRWTAYKAEWDTTKIAQFSINPGVTWSIVIPTRLKDTFMLLESDDEDYLTVPNTESNGMTNTAAAIYNNQPLNRSASTKSGQDASLSKSASFVLSHRYQNEYNNLEIPDVVRYQVSATHYGSNSYDVMPLTDHMTLKQRLLVPVRQNEGKAWTEGLEVYTLQGISYYVLGAGAYQNVYTGNAWADHIIVTDEGQGKYDTRIYWYLNGFKGNSTTTISYLAKVEQNEIVPLTNAYEIANESWLGDHEAHRLHDSIMGSGLVETEPLVTSYDKRIVDFVGDTSEGYDYSFVRRDQTVIYRLTFDNTLHSDFTVTGSQFYDVLPKPSSGFQWSRDNVSLTYWNFKTNDPEDSMWSIIPDPNNESYQKIKWDDEFEMQCTSESGLAYIYVTVHFPSGLDWDNYVQTHQGSILYNTFYIKRNWVNWSSIRVSHELTDTGEVRLQKGVYATGGVDDDNVDVYRTIPDSRLTYENNDVMKRKVYYYITLHNGGFTNLYLNDIQDVLPKGFTLATGSKSSASSSVQSNPRIVGSGYATVEDLAGRPPVSYVSSSYSSLSWRKETTGDGRERIILSVQPRGYNTDTSHYNAHLDRWFLKPGETIAIRLDCFTNEYDDSEDLANNAVTMPYYDFYSQGVTVDSSSSTSAGRPALTKNDGGCDVVDGTFIQSAGFSANEQTAATQWLYSEAEVTRGEIRPGINKSLLKTYEPNAQGFEVENLHPGIVHPNDKLVWQVVAENEGSSAVADYVISDEMPAPYSFVGDVTFRQIYNGDGAGSPEIKLFTVRDRSILVDGKTKASSEMTLVTLNPDGTDAASVKLDIGGPAVELTVPNWRGGNDKVQVSVRMNNGNETMYIRFLNNDMSLLSGGKIEMTFCSQNIPALLQNKAFINRSYISPLRQQSNWDGRTNEGSVAKWETPYQNGEIRSVRSSAQVVSSYGGTTSSLKAIREIADPTNKTNSEGDPNYITLSKKQSPFTYSLSVINTTAGPIRDFVLIDNLPEENDHTTFQTDDARNSPFRVLFQEDLNIAFTIRYTIGSNNAAKAIDPAYYQIELSKKTDFSDADWSGAPSGDWIPLGQIPVGDRASYRSIRLVLHDDEPDDEYCLYKRNYEIMLSFDAVIDQTDPEALPGRIAWNSFGYHFMSGSTPMEAAPLVVGVRIPDLPKVTKTLVNSLGSAYRADREESFTFVLYKGNAITVPAGSDPEQAVRDAKRDYAMITVKVPQGASESEAVSFNGAVGHYFRNQAWEDAEWNMVNQAKYTICEIPAEYYENISLNKSKAKHYEFTYQANNSVFSIPAVNRHQDWSLRLNKEDQFGQKLADAAFAFYSKLEKEQWMTEEEYASLSLEKLNSDCGTELTEKPALVRTHEGVTYYLCAIAKTNLIGTLQLDELMADSYLYQEIQHPSIHYSGNEEPVKVDRPGSTQNALKTVRAVNQYTASGDVTIDATKVLTGRRMEDGEFGFMLEAYDLVDKRVIEASDSKYPPMPSEKQVTCNSAGEIHFGPISLTQDHIGQTYAYRVSEMIPEEGQRAPGLAYDSRKIIVKLTVTDGGDGKIDKTLTYSMVNERDEEITLTGSSAMFQNAYTGEADLDLKTKKNLEGRDWRVSDSFTFRLEGFPNPDDSEAPWDSRRINLIANRNQKEPVFNLHYTQDDHDRTYYYHVYEVINSRAVAYNADTGESLKYNNKDLTYSKYNRLSEEEKAGILPAEKLRWKFNGLISDGTVHTLRVTISYDSAEGRLVTNAVLDQENVTADTQLVFTNAYQADNVQAVLPVGKTISGRPWKRPADPGDPNGDPYPDAYSFTIEATDPEAYTPLPEDGKRTITIERGDTNPNHQIETQVGEFAIPYQWSDLLVDGERLESRDFFYTVRETIDPDQAGARVVRDENGKITGYVLDQITYDLTERHVKITLRDNGQGGLETATVYLDENGNAISDSLVKGTVPFVNTYRPEPIHIPVHLNKLVNGVDAPWGEYSFTLCDGDRNPVSEVLDGEGNALHDITIKAAEDGAELSFRIPEVGKEFSTYKDQPRIYTFYLKEIIPDNARGYSNDGKQLDENGDPLAEGAEPLVYAAAGALRTDSAIVWKKDGIIYDAPEITITVRLEMDPLQYRLNYTVTYSTEPAADSAVFTNHYEAEGRQTVHVKKLIEGREFLDGESFTFILTAVCGAPLRTAEGEKEKLEKTVTSAESVSFDELQFTLDDLKDSANGSWSGKDFSYLVHEVIPEDAFVTDGGATLFYKNASEEKKKEHDGEWTYQSVIYAKDQIVTLHVTDGEEGRLIVTYGEENETEPPVLQFTNLYRPLTAEKAWENYDGTDTPPAGAKVTLELYADGKPTGKTVVLDGSRDEGLNAASTEGEFESWKATWKNLPEYGTAGEDGSAGQPIHYTVMETDIYLPTYAHYASDVPEAGTEVTTAKTAKITNRQRTGELILRKTAETPITEEENKEFGFRITLRDENITHTFKGSEMQPDGTETEKEIQFTKGIADVSVRGGYSLKITGLPQDVDYTVKETEDRFFTTETPEMIGRISPETSEAAFINSRNKAVVRVTKVFSGIDRLPKEFKITNDYNQEVFTAENAEGRGEKEAPYSWTIHDVPTGTEITFTETGIQAAGYYLSVNGTETEEDSATVTVMAWDRNMDKETQTATEPENETGAGTEPENEAKTVTDQDPDAKSETEPGTDTKAGDDQEREEKERNTAAFINEYTYHAEGKSQLRCRKVIQNRPFGKDDTLKVTLTAEEGVRLPEITEIDVPVKEGEYTAEFSFGEIEYDLSDMDGKTEQVFVYTITETAGMPGTRPDTEKHTATVLVKDNGAGLLETQVIYSDGDETEFVNPYHAEGKAQLKGRKILQNRPFIEGDILSVVISAAKGVPLPERTEISVPLTPGESTAEFSFGEITYDLTDLEGEKEKTFTYTITEKAVMAGTTKDADTHTATVTVTDNGKGELETEISYSDGEEIGFVNTYHAEGKARMRGHKEIRNRTFGANDKLKITISAETGVKLPEVTEIDVPLGTGRYVADFFFGEILYDESDMDGQQERTFVYTFTETAEMAGTTPDSGTHTATVLVKDNRKGVLETRVTYSDGDGVSFVNPYDALGSLEIGKEFVFRVTARPTPRQTNGQTPEPTPTPTPEATPEPGETETPTPENIPTTSVTVRKVWDDDRNAAGLRPDHVTVRLSNGMTVTLNERNGWQATISNLPAVIEGQPANYRWHETEVPGYTLAKTTVVGGVTVFVNQLHRHEEPPEGKPVPKRPGNQYLVIEDYGTPLGVEVVINHVGDCFD